MGAAATYTDITHLQAYSASLCKDTGAEVGVCSESKLARGRRLDVRYSVCMDTISATQTNSVQLTRTKQSMSLKSEPRKALYSEEA